MQIPQIVSAPVISCVDISVFCILWRKFRTNKGLQKNVTFQRHDTCVLIVDFNDCRLMSRRNVLVSVVPLVICNLRREFLRRVSSCEHSYIPEFDRLIFSRRQNGSSVMCRVNVSDSMFMSCKISNNSFFAFTAKQSHIPARHDATIATSKCHIAAEFLEANCIHIILVLLVNIFHDFLRGGVDQKQSAAV